MPAPLSQAIEDYLKAIYMIGQSDHPITTTGVAERLPHPRLLELYLSRHLGVSLDRVHSEADRLEHVISEDLEEKIAVALGQPALGPHGEPIPTREGELAVSASRLLTAAVAGQRGIIVRVSDRDAKGVCALAR